MKFRSVRGENAADNTEVSDDWKQRNLLLVLRQYVQMMSSVQMKQGCTGTFSMSKHMLYWQSMYREKKNKERVTVLGCENMSEPEKLTLLTISKFKKPRCF